VTIIEKEIDNLMKSMENDTENFEFNDFDQLLIDVIEELGPETVKKSLGDLEDNQLEYLCEAFTKAIELKKSLVNIDQMGTEVETSDFAVELNSIEDDSNYKILKEKLENFSYGDTPIEFRLRNDKTLYIGKVDEGVYTGHVKSSELEPFDGSYRIERMTLPTLVQYLKAKEDWPEENKAVELSTKKEDAKPPITFNVTTESVVDNEKVYKERILSLLEKLM